jgi:hypothetical protein
MQALWEKRPQHSAIGVRSRKINQIPNEIHETWQRAIYVQSAFHEIRQQWVAQVYSF